MNFNEKFVNDKLGECECVLLTEHFFRRFANEVDIVKSNYYLIIEHLLQICIQPIGSTYSLLVPDSAVLTPT